ncbi:hypothetical protein AK830_g2758 [Neonectria ditissima]|uniref:Linalool dehydratase/isomerase domain-containing protein n=1 Tax=Neonectria ditissima TaxID=78410 RepID=A0A0P7BQQ3_9HYPO|nr:hypothetical protein AK830_g2758 [Neonectria ditissima]
MGLLASGKAADTSPWTDNVQELFSESMEWMDRYYDSKLGYLYDLDREDALRHNTRSSAWYALGLLSRNEDNDVDEAEKIIANVIGGQFTDKSKQWYGTYQKYPEEPEVGTAVYPSRIYSSWDPNWRSFVATTFIVMLEEYSDRLSDETQELILDSLHLATVGDTYRVGGLNGDNLYPAYSNPAIMRAFVSGWLGHRIKDDNMTTSGEAYAQEIIELFNKTDTLSEFNSGTYTGVSLFGLVLWSTYLPEDSVMSKQGPLMLRETWEVVGQLWHPGLKNMAGPWDRAYGYDMKRYLSVMALWFWAYLGKDASSVIDQPEIMTHSADYAWAPLVAVLAGKQAALLPDDFFDDLKTFDKERTFEAQAYYPPYDLETRNITTWLSDKVTAGGMSYNQTQVGGPTGSSTSFTPAVIQWITDREVAFLTLRPTERALQSEVSPGKLSLTYPDGDSSTIFAVVVSTFLGKPTLSNLGDIPGLDVSVSGNVNTSYSLAFAGENGGSASPAHTFEFWSFTFAMPDEFEGAPNLVLEFQPK